MDIEREARKLLEMNRRVTDGHLYTVPSAEHYPYQWLWDSCFHSIILSHYDPAAAKEEMHSLLSKQFKDGMIPHMIYWTPGILHLFRWGVEGTSSITQPPMLAYAVWEIHRADPDAEFLASVFDGLLAYYRFLVEKRDPTGVNLSGIINPDESGEDNSARFDEPLRANPDIGYKDHHALRENLVAGNLASKFELQSYIRDYFWVYDVPFNAILVENLRALAHIASFLKKDECEQWANLHAQAIADAMRKKMFANGAYRSLSGVDMKPLNVSTWAQFAPMFAGLYSPEEVQALVSTQLLNPDTFAAPFGIRTVSKQERAYRAGGFEQGFSWRGSVWMAVHWFIYRGLMRYGYTKEAADIRDKSRALIEQSGFRECFNPETGEGQGASGFTWGALILDMQ